MKKILDKKIVLAIVAFVLALITIWVTGENRINNILHKKKEVVNPSIVKEEDFNLKLLKTVNSIASGGNYLISPYSIETALSMLKEGADGNTLKEIEDLIGSRLINDIVSDKVKVANAIFIKNKYKNNVRSSYVQTLEDKFNSEVIYDNFTSPKVINDWVDEKTDGMIKRILNDIDEDFVLGLANAIAIDVKWMNEFECIDTRKEEWHNGEETTNVEMMHNTYSHNVKYFINESESGIVIPYEEVNGKQLEFIGILPSNELKDYIDNLSKDNLSNIDSSMKDIASNQELNLALPRFTYSYTLEGFKEVLMAMGMKDAFNPDMANFDKMVSDIAVYVSKAIHKTHIELSETGTKAAAVTYFEMDLAAVLPEEKEQINITFNKPFMYIIRDVETKEMLFVGTVYTPNEWKGTTCSNY